MWATHAIAQEPRDGERGALTPGVRFSERTAGMSWFSPGGSWGDVTDRRLYLTGMRTSWVGPTSRNLALAFTMELVPLAIVERTTPNNEQCWTRSDGALVCRRDMSERVAIGAGGSPLGLRLYFNRRHAWRLHASAAFGALMFSNEVPIYDSHILNFSIDYGGGVEIPVRGRHLAIGYRFTHLSNAGAGDLNPGLDANVVYFGLTSR